MNTILVTGGSGFIGSHCILQLLTAGHQVRTTVRSLKREDEVRGMLKRGGLEPDNRLSFIAADLEADAGWAEAVAGCDYVLHVASPFPANIPGRDEELIVPAREGALRVLRASRDAGVKRVVLTSSFAAIGYGQAARPAPFDEADWSDLTGKTTAYVKSKTLAERAAWDFMAGEGGGLELSVVNPVLVLGPILGPDFSTSILLAQRLMNGAVPACPPAVFRRRRRARRRRFASPRHESSLRRRPALPGARRRLHVDSRHRQGAEEPHGRRGEGKYRPCRCPIGCCASPRGAIPW